MMVSSTRPLASDSVANSYNNTAYSQQEAPAHHIHSLIEQLFSTVMVSSTSTPDVASAALPAMAFHGQLLPGPPPSSDADTSGFSHLFAGAYPANPALASTVAPASLPSQHGSFSDISQAAFSSPLHPMVTSSPGAAMLSPYGISAMPLASQASQPQQQQDTDMLNMFEPLCWDMVSVPTDPNVLSPPANSNTIAAQSPLLATYAAPQMYPPSSSTVWHQSAPTTAYALSHPHYQSPSGPELAAFHGSLQSLSATQSPTNSSFLLSGMANQASTTPLQSYFQTQGQFSELRSISEGAFGIQNQGAAASMSPSPSKASDLYSDSDQGSDAVVGPFVAEGGWKNQPRNSISRKQKKLFYKWLLGNTRFPFPTETERQTCLAVDQISEKQFKYWFANIRCRQFTKHRDSEGNLYFAPNAKFYESCIRLGLSIPHSIPVDIRRSMKQPRSNSARPL